MLCPRYKSSFLFSQPNSNFEWIRAFETYLHCPITDDRSSQGGFAALVSVEAPPNVAALSFPITFTSSFLLHRYELARRVFLLSPSHLAPRKLAIRSSPELSNAFLKDGIEIFIKLIWDTLHHLPDNDSFGQARVPLEDAISDSFASFLKNIDERSRAATLTPSPQSTVSTNLVKASTSGWLWQKIPRLHRCIATVDSPFDSEVYIKLSLPTQVILHSIYLSKSHCILYQP